VGRKPPRTRQHVHLRHPGTDLDDREKHGRRFVEALASVGTQTVTTLGADRSLTDPAESKGDAWRVS